ncbi:hypothetical protein BT69DRAFT_1337623 [Atractiella rhizophila]|nr:hypothetical protein BT69DRAFT_1337623 [Atractiella rhizophila]
MSSITKKVAMAAKPITSERTPLLTPDISPTRSRLPSRSSSPSPGPTEFSQRNIQVFGLIHKIRADVVSLIDTPLTEKQLNGVKVLTDLVEPLEKTYLALGNGAIVYALLVNRVHFLSNQRTTSQYSVNHTRADLCEILATRILRSAFPPLHVASSMKNIRSTPPDDDETTYRLAKVLCANFSPFQGAPEPVLKKFAEMDRAVTPTGNALEMAIISEAKQFIRSAACQKTVEDMWNGRIMYTPSAFYDFLPDHYKRREIMLYRPGKSPVLDQYRLLVPKYRARLEFAHFLVLFASYFLCLYTFDATQHHMNPWEIWFMVFALGFSLDKFATGLAHGYTVYMHSLWNGLDAVFVTLFLFYAGLRAYGLKKQEEVYRDQAYAVLTSAACVLFPRFAFVSLADNVLVLSLRALMSSFVFLMFLATWCFAGFATAFYALGRGEYSFPYIAKLMIWLWRVPYAFPQFNKADLDTGLDWMGREFMLHVSDFHPILGPILWVAYACLSSTLVLTILVSMLSHTFSEVNEDAIAEDMYRKAVNTFEGNKSDALFLFQPPFNILALLILYPAGYLFNARWYHKVTVFFARLFNAPLLLTITYASRLRAYRKLREYAGRNLSDSAGRLKKRARMMPKGLLSFVSAHRDIEATFDVELEQDEWEDIFKAVAAAAPPAETFDYNKAKLANRRTDSERSISFVIPPVNNIVAIDKNKEKERPRQPLPVARIFRRGWKDSDEGTSTFGGGSTIKPRRPKRGQTMVETNREEQEVEEAGFRREFDERLKAIEESNKRIEEALTRLMGLDEPLS